MNPNLVETRTFPGSSRVNHGVQPRDLAIDNERYVCPTHNWLAIRRTERPPVQSEVGNILNRFHEAKNKAGGTRKKRIDLLRDRVPSGHCPFGIAEHDIGSEHIFYSGLSQSRVTLIEDVAHHPLDNISRHTHRATPYLFTSVDPNAAGMVNYVGRQRSVDFTARTYVRPYRCSIAAVW